MSEAKTTTTPVWDRLVRAFHWTLVLGVTVAAVSGFLLRPTWITLHIVAGVTAAVLLLLRVLWGIWGSKNARFAGFIKGPRVVLGHLKELRNGTAARHLGHNPLGALMIVALLGTIFLLFATGMTTWGGELKTGPLGFATSYDFGRLTHLWHKMLAIFLMILVLLHIAGAVFEGWRTRENLVKAMVTGEKEAREGDHDLPGVTPRPILVAMIFGILMAGLVWAGVFLSAKPPFGVPHGPMNPTYADECSACHMAYPPSLLKTRVWGSIMTSLDNHFGEDASLDQATVDEITTWLFENAADSVDTKPAHVFSRADPAHPLAITSTPFWKNTHRNIPADVFTRPPIYDNGNCIACHKDADSGAFYPANISIPKETKQ
jgi:cytochrome b